MIDETGIDPSRAIFVDDKLENVLTARSFGMHGIVFEDQTDAIRQLKNLCGDPISRGTAFMTSCKKRFTSVSSSNIEFSDVLVLTVALTEHDLTVAFFYRIFPNSSFSKLQGTSKQNIFTSYG